MAETQRILVAVATLVVVLICVGGNLSKPLSDAVSPNGVHFDPERVVTVAIGTLELNVKNKYLVFPWPEGSDPAIQRQTLERAESSRMRKASAGLEQDLALKFDLPDLSPGTLQKDRRVIAIVKYRAIAPINVWSIAQLANFHDRGSDAIAVPSLDTRSYQAFWLKSNEAMRKWFRDRNMNMGHVNDEVRFGRVDGTAPKVVGCMWPDAPNGELVDCHASMAFVPDLFPATSAERPPYILELEVAPAQIDRLGEIAEAVSKKIRPWITTKPAANPVEP